MFLTYDMLIALALVLGAVARLPIGNTYNLYVEGSAPGSGNVKDSESPDSASGMPGSIHLLRNQSIPLRQRPEVVQGMTLDGVCKHIQLYARGDGKVGKTTLEATCVDLAGQWWITDLNLNLCARNNAGQLVYHDNGQFDNSCEDCIVVDPVEREGLDLRCNCPDGNDTMQYTSLSMGSHGTLLLFPQSHKTLEQELTVSSIVKHPRTIRPMEGRLVCGDRLGTKMPDFGGRRRQ